MDVMSGHAESATLVVGEIINPSDKYTIECSDWLAAAAAVVFLGEGMYALDIEDDDRNLPILAFGGGDAALESWWAKQEGHRGKVFRAWVEDNYARIATALESVVLGNRRRYLEMRALVGPEKFEEFDAIWDDQNRSSMNNIGKRAKALAKHFRAKSETEAQS